MMQSPVITMLMNVPASTRSASSARAISKALMIGRSLIFPMELTLILMMAIVVPSRVPGLMGRFWPETIDGQSKVSEKKHSESDASYKACNALQSTRLSVRI